MKRFVAISLFLLLGVALIVGCGGTSTTTTAPGADGSTTSTAGSTDTTAAMGEPIVIGVVTSLTGPLAATGSQVAVGVQFAAKEWNDKGGVNGRPIEVVVEDDQSTPNGAVNAYNAVLSKDPAFTVGPTFTPLIMPLEPILKDQAKRPMFTSATGTPITKGGDGWFFRMRTNDDKQAAILAQFALDTLKTQKPGLIYPNNDYGKSGLAVMEAALADAGIEFVAVETFNQGTDKDVSAQLNKIKNAGADVLISWTVPTDSGMVNVQAKQVGFEGAILGGPGFGTPEYLKLAGDSAEGVYASIDSMAGQSAETADWKASVLEAFPDTPVSFVVSALYDATNIALEQIEAGADSPEALRDAIAAVKDYAGVTGTYSFDAEHNGLHQGVVGQWTAGKFVPVETIVQLPEQ